MKTGGKKDVGRRKRSTRGKQKWGGERRRGERRGEEGRGGGNNQGRGGEESSSIRKRRGVLTCPTHSASASASANMVAARPPISRDLMSWLCIILITSITYNTCRTVWRRPGRAGVSAAGLTVIPARAYGPGTRYIKFVAVTGP
eukprot:276145-Hanusia_phi.AAC.3